ncbi:hypothetical protein TGAM01_v209720 [Trichoderma gamsii]|uniref:Uncharacterized protein n=1 Tax=Trichoderma gamsii TaxID=398673 RepID=A0A2P4ZAU4_9HYPO|nr:hypothetical protein TGAM01_v209720 [Trichoderma gamsii]PON21419.1 hypothetical protein TGAM01_v209720 [Trichoderma gamsii]
MLHSDKVLCKSPAEGFDMDGGSLAELRPGSSAHDYEVVTVVGLAWTPKLVQLETQDADAGQLVSFVLDRPNQRDAAAEADVNAHTSRHDHCCFFAFFGASPDSWEAPESCWKTLLAHDTTRHNTTHHAMLPAGLDSHSH